MIYDYDFLDKNQLRQFQSLFDSGKFVDGAKTGPKDKQYKDNSQQDDYEINKMVNVAISKLLRDSGLKHLHNLNKCSPCLLLKYEEGQHYADHIDYYEMWGCRTDFTAVINLNDDYEGGEHYFKIGTEVIKRNLEPGKLLFYSTEFVHGVTPVTSGVRKCVTFWIESSIHDQMMRYHITELNHLYKKIHEKLSKEEITKLDEIRMGITKRAATLRN